VIDVKISGKFTNVIKRESDKVYKLLAHGRWFSPASSTSITGRHDIAEILLKVVLKTKEIKIIMKERNVIVCTHTTWSYLCKH
jgi:hypothetical protein